MYKFHNCEASPILEYETFKSINPGLSAYKDDPTAAAASLDPLMEEAKRVVPKELWSCSPVEVKATAGLRLLGATESEAILEEVRELYKAWHGETWEEEVKRYPVPEGYQYWYASDNKEGVGRNYRLVRPRAVRY